MSARRSTRPTASPTLSPVVSRPFISPINPVPLSLEKNPAPKNPLPQIPFSKNPFHETHKIPSQYIFFVKKKSKTLTDNSTLTRPRPLRALRADHRRENKPAPLARVSLLPRAIHARLHARRAHGLPLHLRLLPTIRLLHHRRTLLHHGRTLLHHKRTLHPHQHPYPHLDAPARRPAQDRQPI